MDSYASTVTEETGAEVITVGIADDNAVVRAGIRGLLATTSDIRVVGEAGDGAAAVALARAKRPTVMLLDVRMPRQDGVTAATEISAITNVLMLTYSEAPDVISAAIRAGALGYLVHGHFGDTELIQAVRMVAGGIGTFSAQTLAALSSPAPSLAELATKWGLSEREAEVMDLIAKGSANTDIARGLFISEKTVKNHINRIFAKLQANNRGHAISLWLATPQ